MHTRCRTEARHALRIRVASLNRLPIVPAVSEELEPKKCKRRLTRVGVGAKDDEVGHASVFTSSRAQPKPTHPPAAAALADRDPRESKCAAAPYPREHLAVGWRGHRTRHLEDAERPQPPARRDRGRSTRYSACPRPQCHAQACPRGRPWRGRARWFAPPCPVQPEPARRATTPLPAAAAPSGR